MIQFSLLGSGSSGNALLVVGTSGKILIDNGLSFRQLERRTQHLGLSLDDLAAVFVTHEHGDHVNGIGVLARKRDVPIYMTQATCEHLPKKIGAVPRIEIFESGETITVEEFTLTSFSVSHDAADPVSFTVNCNGCRLGLATDLGRASHLVRQRLKGCHALLLDSNYCPEMLRTRSHPIAIRQRTGGAQGHRPAHEMNSLLSGLLHDELQMVIAVHVSQENNSEEKARTLASQVLRNHSATLVIAQQDEPTPLFTVQPHGAAQTAPPQLRAQAG